MTQKYIAFDESANVNMYLVMDDIGRIVWGHDLDSAITFKSKKEAVEEGQEHMESAVAKKHVKAQLYTG
jgi:hypothetical protein